MANHIRINFLVDMQNFKFEPYSTITFFFAVWTLSSDGGAQFLFPIEVGCLHHSITLKEPEKHCCHHWAPWMDKDFVGQTGVRTHVLTTTVIHHDHWTIGWDLKGFFDFSRGIIYSESLKWIHQLFCLCNLVFMSRQTPACEHCELPCGRNSTS